MARLERQTTELKRQMALDSFKQGLSSHIGSVIPADSLTSEAATPSGAVLPHYNHGTFISHTIGEIASRLPLKKEHDETTLMYSKAQTAIDRATNSIAQHFEAHRTGDDEGAMFHLRNAADGVHDAVLHIRDAEEKNRVSLENSILNGSGIDIKNLNRDSKTVEPGIFDKLSETLNSYGEETGLGGTTKYTDRGFALQDMPGERVTPSSLAKRAQKKARKSEVYLGRTSRVSWIQDDVNPADIESTKRVIKPSGDEDPKETAKTQKALDIAHKNWSESSPEERTAAYNHFKHYGKPFQGENSLGGVLLEHEKAAFFARLNPIERDKHLTGGKAMLKAQADYAAQSKSKEAETASDELGKEVESRSNLTTSRKSDAFATGSGEAKS